MSLTENRFEHLHDALLEEHILGPDILEDYSFNKSPEGQAKQVIDRRDMNGDGVLGPLELLPMGGNEFEGLAAYVFGVWVRDCQDGRINKECEMMQQMLEPLARQFE